MNMEASTLRSDDPQSSHAMTTQAETLPLIGRVRPRHVNPSWTLDAEAIGELERDAKVALLATLDEGDLPHVTLITSLQAKDGGTLMFGQFTEGTSKANLARDPRAGFLIMNAERCIWRGKARWTGQVKSGDDYELYNHKPMFRYNAYFGIHTVHHLDVVEYLGKQRLSVGALAAAWAPAMLSRPLVRARGGGERVLTPWAEAHVSRLSTLKFPCYVGRDGYPVVLPPVAACAAGHDRLLIAPGPGVRELSRLGTGTCIAAFALNLKMESVLVRGRLAGLHRYLGADAAVVEIDWVYNSMPPKQGRIYPREPLLPIVDFDEPSWCRPPGA